MAIFNSVFKLEKGCFNIQDEKSAYSWYPHRKMNINIFELYSFTKKYICKRKAHFSECEKI